MIVQLTRSHFLFFAFVTLLALLSASTAQAETDAERKARLERELANVELQIQQQQVLVEGKQEERQSLERDINILDAQIKKAKLGIQARSLVIEQLEDQIGDKASVIVVLNDRVARQRQSLGQLLRKTQEIDDYTLVEIMLGRENFSHFFEDLESFQSIKVSLNESVDLLKEIKTDTEGQKQSLEEKQLSEEKMKQIQEQQKKEVEEKEREKGKILTVTKGQEQEYKKLLESQQKTAAQLRSALFALLGGGGGIPFPDAVRLAQYAEEQTGVKAATILAILEQETNLGAHLGSCIYNEMRGGKAVMHPDRDAPIFLVIAKELGFDAATRQVSCPITSNGVRYGWGGAMGPSQFIPSTWAMYGGVINSGGVWSYDKSRDVIRSLNGGSLPANPFNNQDAFLATALLLRDNGANGTYAGDRLAALRYYAGWGGASNPANAFYGDQVMNRKARLEGDIRTLAGG